MKSVHAFVSAAALMLSVASTGAQANLLDDGSFEAATSASTTSNSAWVLNANMPDGVDRAAEFRTASFASYPAAANETGVWFRSFEGNQGGGGDPTAEATLTQTVSNVAGGDYTLTGWYKVESNFTANTFSILFDTDTTGSSVSLTPVIFDGEWRMFSGTIFNVDPSDDLTVTVTMGGGVDAMINPQSAFVDAFELTGPESTIPEPASLGLLGALGLGLAARRRR